MKMGRKSWTVSRLFLLLIMFSSRSLCDETIHRYPFFYSENTNVSELLVPFSAIDADSEDINRNVNYSFVVSEVTWNERAIDYYEGNFSDSLFSSKTNDQIQEYFLEKDRFPNIWNPFRMEPESGTIFLQHPLDYELIVSYQLEVTARNLGNSSIDQSWNSRNKTSLVFIHVTDVNDNRPIFVNYEEIEKGLEVYENNLIGHIVGEVRAVDFDSLPNSQITFEIEPVLDFQNFTISAKTGQIQALDSFDFERKPEYMLKITAKNDDAIKSSILVTIRIKDINEWIDGRTPDAISFGVVATIMFFVILLLVISTSFILFHKQKEKEKLKKKKESRVGIHSHGVYGGHGSSSSTLSVPRKLPSSSLPPTMKDLRNMSLMPTPAHLSFRASLHSSPGNSVPRLNGSTNATLASNHQLRSQLAYSGAVGVPPSPDVVDPPHPHPHLPHPQQQHQKQIGGPPHSATQSSHPPPGAVSIQSARIPPAPPSSSFVSNGCDNYSEILANEPFDLENVSSLAPSDIDLAFRFKGYHQRMPSIPPHPPHPSMTSDVKPDHRHVPLARLSPSVSELTAPRILTLQDLSPSQAGLSKGHHTAVRMPCSRRPVTGMSPPSSDEDDDGAHTVDSFTSSEYEETYKIQSKRNGGVYDRGVW